MMDNASAVKVFTLSAVNETVTYKLTIFSLALVYYCLILFLNISLIVIIVLDSNLHEPMYILLCSFCFNALYGTAGFYPKFLIDLQTTSPEISYDACLLQAFIMYSFACSDLSILAVMAYDRYLAICRPLHYHSIMSKKRLSQLVCFSWMMPLSIFAISIIRTSKLRLCSSRIQKIFCVNWVVVKLACPENEIISNNILSYATIIIYVCHGFFIMWTYMHMVKTCIRSKDDQRKFMQTCVPHLTSLTTFLFTILYDLMYMRFGSTTIPQSLQNFIAIEFVVIPPFINPLIYGLKLAKIRKRIVYLLRYTGK
ncbi:olfactory receptor 4E1-like [Periophthalmus magnuspinnatus]|uniref:olfactory receptor 4E1-like n=1 Tax=Periophthalmus magnuspinnatus TaxID=409849 RepID=UPI00145BEC09|nr:olfactory receptor 4E1-like [Periophthalmus magnuspinnatus]